MELFSYANTPYHFFWLSHILGFNYDALVGSLEINGQFTLELETFSQGIEKLLVVNE